jgi:hypothetical protein
VQACPEADAEAVRQLLTLRDRLDPFTLVEALDAKLERLVTLATPARRPPSAAPAGAVPRGRPVARQTPWHHFTHGQRVRARVRRAASVTS